MSQNFYDYDISKDGFQSDNKVISKLFLYLTLSLIIPYLILTLASFAISFFSYIPPSVLLIINDSYTVFVIILFCLFSRNISSRRPIALQDMTNGRFFLLACASVPLMLIGAFTGNAIASLFGNVLGHEVTNAIGSLTEDYPFPLVFVSVVIIAPVFEELMFRKLLIDKISRFGFSFSILASGLVFGTFHGNFYQLFYGCLLGFLLAFVYCMYAKLRYCIILHSLINFIGFVCPIYLVKFLSSPYLILNFVAVCYSLLYYICIPFGVIVIILGMKTIYVKYPFVFSLPGKHMFRKNFGIIAYLAFVTIILALSLFV